MASVFLASIVMASIVMASIGMARYHPKLCSRTAKAVAYIVMACKVMAYKVMAYFSYDLYGQPETIQSFLAERLP